MKIYTKSGDKGETSLYGGKRVPKDDVRICAYGTIDELNSYIGLIRSRNLKSNVEEVLQIIQNDLFVLGAYLATPIDSDKKPSIEKAVDHIPLLEKTIDSCEVELKPLKHFILPGGSETAAHFHIARTICRRAERNVVKLHHSGPINQEVLIYLNRLSDLLFVFGRYANKEEGGKEEPWIV